MTQIKKVYPQMTQMSADLVDSFLSALICAHLRHLRIALFYL